MLTVWLWFLLSLPGGSQWSCRSWFPVEKMTMVRLLDTQIKMKRINEEKTWVCYPAVRRFGSFIGFHISQFHRPFIVELLQGKHNARCRLFIPAATKANYSHSRELNFFLKTNLLFGHVQQAHRVPVAQQIGPHGVERLVELPLDVRQLLKHFTGRPEQHLRSPEERRTEDDRRG